MEIEMPFEDAVEPAEEAASAAPSLTPGRARKLTQINGADQLVYLADIIGEFRTIAENLGAETLSELLDVSQSEALRAASRLRRAPADRTQG